MVWIGFLAVVLPAAGQTPGATSTNHWLRITEVLAKWDGLPLAEIQQAGERGDLTAQYYLGYSYTEGHRFAVDTPLGISWYERAGDGGYLPAINRLGQLYQRGKGVPRDYPKALRYYQAASVAGYAPEQYGLGYSAQNTLPDEAKTNLDFRFSKMADAIMWYTLAADQHWPPAEFNLGRCYLNAMGVPRNEEKAVELFRRAADHGDVEGMIELADAYAEGIGEPRNEADGSDNLLVRATTSVARDTRFTSWAYDRLVARRIHGLGGAVDMISAADFYCRAAASGAGGYNISDKIEVEKVKTPSYVYFTGGTEHRLLSPARTSGGKEDQSFYAILSLYLKSAKGDGAARLKIGEAYLAGRNVPKSPARAWAWFTLAAERDEPEARQKIMAAEAVLTPGALSEARGLVRKISQDLGSVAATLGGR